MRRKLLLLFGLILSCGMMAAPVTLQEAQQRAQQFLSRHGAAPHGMRLAKQQPRLEAAQQDNAYYYVFNVGQEQGFVIVSGDDRTPAILGYADQGSFADQDMPDNMRAWLQGYEEQMKWMEQHPELQQAQKKAGSARSSINPLITTMWDQGKPYDRETPIAGLTNVSDQNGNYVRTDTTFCVTGCVATAMAQIMYYHRWPEGATTAIPAYSSGWSSAGSTLPATTTNLPSTTFDWTKMRDTYTDANFAPELAKLMRYCGQSVKMHYDAGESGASTSDVVNALKSYFDYDNAATFINRDEYTAAQWADIIYSELQQERPVLYSGSSTGGGHAFIIDGYSEDEYYHINWGWSGRHNGYFLLSVLNPNTNSESGASSSKDGYSMSQGAGIGIQKQQGTPMPDAVISCMELTATNTTPEHFSNGFYIQYSYKYGNFSGKEGTVDVALGLFNEADDLLESSSPIGNSVSIQNNQYLYGSGSSMMAEGLADGTYYIKMVYKTAEAEDWLKTKDADLYAITAVVEGTTMTLTNAVQPTIELVGATITADGTPEAESPTMLTTNITNNGNSIFNGYLYLFVDNTLAGGKMFEVEGGQAKDFSIEYIPTSTGNKELKICTNKDGTNTIATGSITVIEPEGGVPTDNVDLTFAQEIINAEGTNVLGKTAQVKITITNNTSSNYSGVMCLLTWKWTGGNGSANGPYSEITIPANSTIEIIRVSDELTGADKYSFTTFYYKNGEEVEDQSKIYEFYTPVDAYTAYDAAGNPTMKRAVATITTDAATTFVDLRGQTAVQTVESQANPNTIFLLDDDASITGATNVVKGSTAESIVLTDGYDFYTPVAFTAQQISYTRTFTTGYATDGSGWSTITLPFAVSKVTAEGNEIDWFHGEGDTGKNFWVMAFDGDNGSTVNFTYVSQMQANTPYIIAVPGSQYKPQWQLVNKPLTFSATDIQVLANAKAALTGNAYKFMGSFVGKAATSDYYVMNSEGTSFEKGSTAVEPFRAYFTPTSNSSQHSSLSITFVGGQTTAIEMLNSTESQASDGQIYDLQGRKVNGQASKGIYIINGKKYIKH